MECQKPFGDQSEFKDRFTNDGGRLWGAALVGSLAIFLDPHGNMSRPLTWLCLLSGNALFFPARCLGSRALSRVELLAAS